MTFKSRPVLDVRPHWGGPEASPAREDAGGALGHGVETRWPLGEGVTRDFALDFLATSRAAVAELEAFFDAREGRFSGFWVPTWRADLRLAADVEAGSAGFEIEAIGLADRFADLPGYPYLALLSAEGFELVEALGAAPKDGDASREVVTTTAPITTAHAASETTVSWLIFARFGEDAVSWRYETDEIAATRLTFLELSQEYAEQQLGDRPVFLYRLTQGDAVHHWTGYGAEVEAGGQTWRPQNLVHSGLTRSTEFLDEGVKLQFATREAASPLRQFLGVAPPEAVTVDLYQIFAPGFAVDLEAPLYSGQIGQVEYGPGGQIRASLSSLLRVAEHQVPRFLVSQKCNHVLYQPQTCRLLQNDFELVATLASVEGRVLVAPEFAAQADDWLSLGKVRVGGEWRSILSHQGDTITVNVPFRAAAAGAQAFAYAGCDKLAATCRDKFANFDNFGGFPYLPDKNPQLDAFQAPATDDGKKS